MRKEIKINGITFLEFCNIFRGLKILDKNDKEVPKYILFWKRLKVIHIKENYKLIDRDTE